MLLKFLTDEIILCVRRFALSLTLLLHGLSVLIYGARCGFICTHLKAKIGITRASRNRCIILFGILNVSIRHSITINIRTETLSGEINILHILRSLVVFNEDAIFRAVAAQREITRLAAAKTRSARRRLARGDAAPVWPEPGPASRGSVTSTPDTEDSLVPVGRLYLVTTW